MYARFEPTIQLFRPEGNGDTPMTTGKTRRVEDENIRQDSGIWNQGETNVEAATEGAAWPF